MNKSIVRPLGAISFVSELLNKRTVTGGDKTMHVHHIGRAEYTLIMPSTNKGSPPTVKRVIMGPDVLAGEQRQLVVGTGVWKMSRLLDVDLKGPYLERTGCLITEVVVPGFHSEDHRYLTQGELEELFAADPEALPELLKYVKGV
jgi:uncharacterized protein